MSSDPLPSALKKIDHLNIPAPLRHPLRAVRIIAADFVRTDLLKQASAMAYVTLLSLIPSLVAIFCVLSLFAPLMAKGSNLIDKVQTFILQNLASGSGEAAVMYLDRMLEKLNLANLGWSSFASVLVTLVMLLRQIEEALNRIWHVRQGRNILIRFMYFWTFLTLGIVALAIAVGFSSGLELQKWLNPAKAVETSFMAPLISWILSVGGGFIFFFFLYKIVPNCFVKAKNAAIGAGLSALLLHEAGQIYGLYVAHSVQYTTLYGALAQLPIFLLWLYICWTIILLGALVSWRLQEGFPKEKANDGLAAAKSPTDLLRNNQIRATLPSLALTLIHQRFQDGSGKGLSAQELAHQLKIPASWASEAVDALVDFGYVVAGQAEHTSDIVTITYFPTKPSNLINLRDAAERITAAYQHWAQSCDQSTSAFFTVLTPADDASRKTLADLLK